MMDSASIRILPLLLCQDDPAAVGVNDPKNISQEDTLVSAKFFSANFAVRRWTAYPRSSEIFGTYPIGSMIYIASISGNFYTCAAD
jgi:hypothetical protein